MERRHVDRRLQPAGRHWGRRCSGTGSPIQRSSPTTRCACWPRPRTRCWRTSTSTTCSTRPTRRPTSRTSAISRPIEGIGAQYLIDAGPRSREPAHMRAVRTSRSARDAVPATERRRRGAVERRLVEVPRRSLTTWPTLRAPHRAAIATASGACLSLPGVAWLLALFVVPVLRHRCRRVRQHRSDPAHAPTRCGARWRGSSRR